MKITKDEIKKIAKTVKININDEELSELESSIEEITTRFEEMLSISETEERMISPCENMNKFNEEFGNEKVDLEKLNNYQDGYFSTKKVIDHE